MRGDYFAMRRLTDEARQVAERLSTPLIRLASHRLAGITAMYFGAFADGRSEFEAILRLYDARRHRSEPMHYVHDPKSRPSPILRPSSRCWAFLSKPVVRARGVPLRR